MRIEREPSSGCVLAIAILFFGFILLGAVLGFLMVLQVAVLHH